MGYIIVCVIVASFANCNEWNEIELFVDDNYNWFKSFLQMTGGIPTSQTYERVIGGGEAEGGVWISLVDSDELNKILFEFFDAITLTTNGELDILSLDGRVNNGSGRKETMDNSEIISLNCLNAYSSKYKYCLYTKMISEKSNEIPTIEELISGLDLTGVIVTWDVLNTKVSNVEAVIKAHGDYVIPIKKNQGVFYQDLVAYFDKKCCEQIKAGNTKSSYLYQMEKSHSSIIEYEYYQTSDISWYHRKEEWKGIKTIGMVKKM